MNAGEIEEESKTAKPNDEKTASAATASGISLGAMLATAAASACLSLAASIIYFSYFPPRPAFPPVMAADMIRISESVAEMSRGDIDEAERLFKAGAETMRRLRSAGVVVLDAKAVLSAPGEVLLRPSDLIPGAPDRKDAGEFGDRRAPADLFYGTVPFDDRAGPERESDADKNMNENVNANVNVNMNGPGGGS